MGDSNPVTDKEIIGPALAAEEFFRYSCLTPATGPTVRALSDLRPTALGLMHGPSYTGDCAQALRDLADAYDARLHEDGARLHEPRSVWPYRESPGS